MLKRGAEATEGQRWLKSNVFGLTSALQGATSLAAFGERLVSGLVPMVGGGIAAFYLYEEHPEGLRRIAGYGLPAGAASAATVAVGAGLVGQCARERKDHRRSRTCRPRTSGSNRERARPPPCRPWRSR